jgi:uroporphyrinogen-III decarboxylase
MVHSSPEVVTEKAREAIANLSAGGGFILGPGCALPGITPDENIHALVEAAKRFKPVAA